MIKESKSPQSKPFKTFFLSSFSTKNNLQRVLAPAQQSFTQCPDDQTRPSSIHLTSFTLMHKLCTFILFLLLLFIDKQNRVILQEHLTYSRGHRLRKKCMLLVCVNKNMSITCLFTCVNVLARYCNRDFVVYVFK